MPKYVYHCKECDGEFETVHGMTERLEDCPLCSSTSSLRRIPQMTNIKTFESSTSEQRSVGSHVKEAIEENAKLLNDMKQKARTQEYKDGN